MLKDVCVHPYMCVCVCVCVCVCIKDAPAIGASKSCWYVVPVNAMQVLVVLSVNGRVWSNRDGIVTCTAVTRAAGSLLSMAFTRDFAAADTEYQSSGYSHSRLTI